MVKPHLSRLPLALGLWLRRAHPMDGLIAALLAVAVLGWFVWLPALQARVDATQDAVRQGRRQLRLAAQAPAVQAPVAEGERLQAFEQQLGDPAQLEASLHTLFGIAQSLGVSLSQGQYKMQCEAHATYCRYQVLWPVHGPYGVLRLMTEQSLRALPFASLDEFSLRRESASGDELEGRIGLSLHLRRSAEWRVSDRSAP